MHFRYFTLHRGVVLIKAQGTIIVCTSQFNIAVRRRDGAF